jgi:hypothetical protein
MRNVRALSLPVSVLLLVTAWSHPATAETIEIIGGGVSEVALNSQVQWSNYGLVAVDSSFNGHVCCGISAAIPPFGGGASLSGGAGLVFDVPSIAASENVVHGTPVSALVRGGLGFTAPTLVLPPPTLGASWQLSSPFTATGHISGLSTDHGQELFSFDLEGSGTATVSGVVVNFSQPRYVPLLAVYEFAPASSPSPTPEPAGVWLLLASGVVTALYRGVRTMCV